MPPWATCSPALARVAATKQFCAEGIAAITVTASSACPCNPSIIPAVQASKGCRISLQAATRLTVFQLSSLGHISFREAPKASSTIAGAADPIRSARDEIKRGIGTCSVFTASASITAITIGLLKTILLASPIESFCLLAARSIITKENGVKKQSWKMITGATAEVFPNT